jgi:hypothetical protein
MVVAICAQAMMAGTPTAILVCFVSLVMAPPSLSERWTSWLLEAGNPHHTSSGTSGYTLKLRTFHDMVLPALKTEGFALPPLGDWSASREHALPSVLQAGLEPLATTTGRYSNSLASVVSLVHLVNFIWQPIIGYVEDLAGGHKPKWTSDLQHNHTTLLREMEGIVLSADDTMSVDNWIGLIRQTLMRLVGVDVPVSLVSQTIGLLVPFNMNATPANAMHILRSSLAAKLVGSTLAMQVSRQILADVAELPVPLLTEIEESLGLKNDLVTSLVQLHTSKATDDADEQPAKRFKAARPHKDRCADKTLSVQFVLENRVSWRRFGDTVIAAGKLIENLISVPGSSGYLREGPCLEDILVGRHQLMKHTLLLDGAIDRFTSDEVLVAREQNNFAGVALATDESPPSQHRFLGLRFQITVMYMGRYVPQHMWESRTAPPISRTSMLADIMHCPGKKGTDVSKVLEKQLARVGLNAYDVVGCTGIYIYV